MALSFAFGGDTGETPESIKRKREIADALIGRTFSRTPQNIGEGLSAIGQALAYRRLSARAAEGEKSGLEKAGAAMNSVGGALAGPQAFPAAPGASSADGDSVSASPMVRPDDPNLPSRLDFARADARAGVAPPSGGGDIEGYIRQAALKRGIDPEIAVRVARSEGGLKDPFRQSDIVKNGVREPSYGPFQLYMGGGLGNKALEAGIDPRKNWQGGVDFALDQAAAGGWGPWYGAKAIGVTGMQGIGQRPKQVASLDPSIGMPSALEMPASPPTPIPSPRQNVVNAVQRATPPRPQANPQIAQALVGGDNLPVTAGGSGGAIQYGPQGGPSIQMLMNAAGNQFLNDNQRGIVNALIGQQIEASDPMRQLQLQKLQQEVNAKPERKTTTINGRLVDAQTGEEIANFEDPNAKAPTVQKLKLDDGSEMAVQWNPETGKWDPIDAPQGGGGIAPKTKLTENQSKLTLFQSLQTESQPVLIDLEKQFNPANIPDAAARLAPIAGNFFQSEQGQIYEAASTAWAEGALRIATGAAATPEEMERTKKAYFAQPGDTPITIAFKAQMRDMYNRSIERALGKQSEGSLPKPSDFVKQFQKGGASTSGAGHNPPTVIDGYTIEEVE